MRQRTSYTGWNFDTLWTIEEGQGYPTLRSSPAPSPVLAAPPASRSMTTLPPGIYAVALHDIRGAVAWRGEARWTGARWNLPTLSAGAWSLRVRTANGVAGMRVVPPR